jgi:hypothetical protein
MSQQNTNKAIRQWLEQRGYSAEEVERILDKLAAYDQKTLSDAVFDSIGQGTMTLDAIIAEALGKSE